MLLMFSFSRRQNAYTPLYFLASLGMGGLAVTFFMYLLFWVPHKGKAVPTFEDISLAASGGEPMMIAAITVAMLGIAYFGFQNIRFLIWNLRAYSDFKTSQAYQDLRESNAETQILALPLALAMSVNVAFILGLVFIPGLWSVIEYLFPLAMMTFVLIGWIAFRQIGDFLGRVLVSGGGFSHAANNSYAQLLPAFALAMVGVGLAAPAALSTSSMVAGLSVIASTFFLTAAVIYAAIALVLGTYAMFEHGAAPEAAPTLMIVIPILTVLGILALRQDHGLHAHFDSHAAAGDVLMFLTILLSAQFLFGLLGLKVLKQQHYVARYLTAEGKRSAGSYALVCPGIAISVMIHFFVNKGLVAAGLVDKFSAGYWLVTLGALFFQALMILLVMRLNKLHFGSLVTPTPLAAE